MHRTQLSFCFHCALWPAAGIAADRRQRPGALGLVLADRRARRRAVAPIEPVQSSSSAGIWRTSLATAPAVQALPFAVGMRRSLRWAAIARSEHGVLAIAALTSSASSTARART